MDAKELIERVRAMHFTPPTEELGPTDEPESQFRFGYNTALEDVLEVLAALPADAAQAPVAWMLQEPGQSKRWYTSGEAAMQHWVSKGAIATPLYATPVAPQAAGDAAQAPEGWKLVPVEPNDEMQAAGAQAVRMDTTVLNRIWTANAVFRAMVNAAPTPPVAKKES